MDVELLTRFENEQIGERQPLPERYLGLPDGEMEERIARARAALGARLLILGHHYQRDEVIRFADYTGDSFKLARQAAECRDADYIVFCGVHFMAESADVLSAPHQQVVLPDLAAGCSMADMAEADQLEVCWESSRRWAPGTWCRSLTSTPRRPSRRSAESAAASSARRATPGPRWSGRGGAGRQILFLPDQHLGRNTAYKMGVPLDEMVVWDPDVAFGGVSPEALQRARMILWRGIAPSTRASTSSRWSTCEASTRLCGSSCIPSARGTWSRRRTDSGSTEYIIKKVTGSPAGSTWAVGTEVHLVNRLAQALAPGRTVLTARPDRLPVLDDVPGVARITCCGLLEGLLEGVVHNRIVRPGSREALDAGGARPDAGNSLDSEVALDSKGDPMAHALPAAAVRLQTRWSRISTSRRCAFTIRSITRRTSRS